MSRPVLGSYDDSTVVGLDYYGVILPPEVESKIGKINGEVDALENDLRTFFATKYGTNPDKKPSEPGYYKTPADSWAAGDLQFAKDFDTWATNYRKWAGDYIAMSTAEKWILSNSLAAYKEAEGWEAQLAEWQKKAKTLGVNVTSPTPVSNVTKVDVAEFGSAIKWIAIGVAAYLGIKVVSALPSSSTRREPEERKEQSK